MEQAANYRVVQQEQSHMFKRGDCLMKYDATYQLGKTTVHVVAPKITPEENLRRFNIFNQTAWKVWNSLTVNERLKINYGVDITKILQQVLIKKRCPSSDRLM